MKRHQILFSRIIFLYLVITFTSNFKVELNRTDLKKKIDENQSFQGPRKLEKMIIEKRKKGVLLPFRVNVFRGRTLLLSIFDGDNNCVYDGWGVVDEGRSYEGVCGEDDIAVGAEGRRHVDGIEERQYTSDGVDTAVQNNKYGKNANNSNDDNNNSNNSNDNNDNDNNNNNNDNGDGYRTRNDYTQSHYSQVKWRDYLKEGDEIMIENVRLKIMKTAPKTGDEMITKFNQLDKYLMKKKKDYKKSKLRKSERESYGNSQNDTLSNDYALYAPSRKKKVTNIGENIFNSTNKISPEVSSDGKNKRGGRKGRRSGQERKEGESDDDESEVESEVEQGSGDESSGTESGGDSDSDSDSDSEDAMYSKKYTEVQHTVRYVATYKYMHTYILTYIPV